MSTLVAILLVALTLAVALLAVLVAGLLRSHAEILRSLHELGAGREDTAPKELPFEVGRGVVEGAGPVGQPAADLSGTTPAGDGVLIPVRSGQNTLVAFLSSGCLTCQRIWDRLAQATPLRLPPATRLVVITRDADAESPSTVARLAAGPEGRGVEVLMSSAAWEAYEVPGSPYFVFVDGSTGQATGEGSATDWEQVERLVTEAVGDRVITLQDRRRDVGDGAHREARANRELLNAGITPDHPSLRLTATEQFVDQPHEH